MIRIYVAGAMSNKECINYLENCRKMERVSTELLLAGFAPYCPALDRNFFFQLNDGEKITGPMIKAYSIEWMKQCHAVLVLPGWLESSGTREEIRVAMLANIPVFFSKEAMLNYFIELGGQREEPARSIH